MNSAIVIFNQLSEDKDMETLLSAIQYLLIHVNNGKFNKSKIMLSKPSKTQHIHEFEPLHASGIDTSNVQFVKCIHCSQCFPIHLEKE